MASTLIAERKAPDVNRSSRPDERGTVWSLFTAAGAAFMVIGWTDIGLLWYPLQITNVEWEFSTITASVNALPLPTLGLVLIAAAGLGRRSIMTVRVAAVLASIVGLVLLAWGVFFTLAVLAGWPAIDPGMRLLFARAVAKTSILVLVYVLLHGWLAWTAFRSASRKEGSS